MLRSKQPPLDPMTPSPFNPDELSAQTRAGKGAAGAGIRTFMPDQHRDFFALLPYLFVATLDARSWPIASVLTGAPGFVRSPDATTLGIAALPAADDPAAPGFTAGAEIGLLGIDFTTRRRNRANGRLVAVTDGLTVRVTQSFGNCAQYIQVRRPAPRPVRPSKLERLSGLDDAACCLIKSSDTFFVASRSRAG